MTEKKMNPDRELTPEEQQQLEGEEQFFKQQFSSLPSPKLPGSKCTGNVGKNLCGRRGPPDHGRPHTDGVTGSAKARRKGA